jgi:general secretion pathway protein H
LAITVPRAGFTLLEVLVVLVIISVVISLATLTVDTRQEEVEEQVRRLAAVVRLASEEAVLRSRELALEIKPDGYQFLELAEKEFLPVEDDAVFRQRQLPEGLELSLLLEGEPVDLEAATEVFVEEPEQPPRILLLSSGEITPFELRFLDVYNEVEWVLTGELTGAIEVERGEP